MKRLLTLLFTMAFVLVSSAQTLRNPVIPGYHPDPSVVCVGNDFYLVNSSFQYCPGVPIFHSRDLVHWEQIGNVLNRESQLPLKGATSWLGIYAPTIRYHEGTYYMITTNVGNGGNFMVTAKDPRGPWSDPIWLDQQGIDPSLWFEKGKCYMVSNPDNTITLCEINPKTGQQLTVSRPIWRGTGGRYPEGPHLYKKDGWYYLLISEGGTELAHRLTIARSRQIEGPYEACPDNPLLTNCSMAGQSMQIQGTGHGDLVQSPDERWWLVFLAYRNFGGSYHHLGRETCMVPVEWKEGQWPVVNGGLPVDTVMNAALLPAVPVAKPARRTLFTAPLGPEWVHIQNPIAANYEQKDGLLWLRGHGSLTDNEQPTFVGRRQESAVMTVETEIDLDRLDFGTEAGLTVYQINDGHYDFSVTRYQTGTVSVQASYRLKSIESAEMENLGKTGRVQLRISSDGLMYRFEYSQNGASFQQLAQYDCPMVSTEVVGGFTGVVLGMFADGEGRAAFSYFDYAEE